MNNAEAHFPVFCRVQFVKNVPLENIKMKCRNCGLAVAYREIDTATPERVREGWVTDWPFITCPDCAGIEKQKLQC